MLWIRLYGKLIAIGLLWFLSIISSGCSSSSDGGATKEAIVADNQQQQQEDNDNENQDDDEQQGDDDEQQGDDDEQQQETDLSSLAMPGFEDDGLFQPVFRGLAGVSAAQGLPELGSKMSYVVRRGDTLSKIALRVYGSARQWVALAKASALKNPNLIYPGDLIYYQLSKETLSFAKKYENAQRRQLVVGAGETLPMVAKRVYGYSEGWKTLWRENDQVNNPNVLEPGMVLYYSQDDLGHGGEALTRQVSPQVESYAKDQLTTKQMGG